MATPTILHIAAKSENRRMTKIRLFATDISQIVAGNFNVTAVAFVSLSFDWVYDCGNASYLFMSFKRVSL